MKCFKSKKLRNLIYQVLNPEPVGCHPELLKFHPELLKLSSWACRRALS